MAKKGHYSKHPCVYTDNYGAPHLVIFRNFFVETELLKHKKMDPETAALISSHADYVNGANSNSNSDTDEAGSLIPSWRRMNTYPGEYERQMEQSARENKEKKGSFFSRLLEACKPKKNTEKAFEEIKDSMKIPNTPNMKESLKTVEKLHKMLHDTGQYTQAEKVENYARILTFELNLINAGYDKYLTEKDVIDFMLKCERGVSITFLRYFSDILPIEVGKKKIEIDKMKIFDNYCVLYYDPKQEIFTWHEEDEARRIARDPILFGMIDGSDKLYYICDWVYKDDDLTMEKVEAITNRKARMLKDAEIANTDLMIKDAINKLSEWSDAISPAE